MWRLYPRKQCSHVRRLYSGQAKQLEDKMVQKLAEDVEMDEWSEETLHLDFQNISALKYWELVASSLLIYINMNIHQNPGGVDRTYLHVPSAEILLVTLVAKDYFGHQVSCVITVHTSDQHLNSVEFVQNLNSNKNLQIRFWSVWKCNI